MGRSQVLYNRTKGRNRNRAGRGGNQESTKSKSSNTNHRKQGLSNQIPRQYHPNESLDRIASTDYEHEYEVLFAGRSTYLSSRGGSKSEEEDLVGGGKSNYGSICIPSMAATLESMDIAKRLRIPIHVAARAFPDKVRIEEEEKQEQQQEDNAAATVSNESSASSEQKIESSPDPDSSNLEDWLDDVCGIDDDSNAENDTGRATKAASNTEKNANATNQTTDKNSTSNKETSEKLTANAEEENGEDNLDDWLDSMIE